MRRHLSQQYAMNNVLLRGMLQYLYRRLLTGSLASQPPKFFNEFAVRNVFAIDEKRHKSPSRSSLKQ